MLSALALRSEKSFGCNASALTPFLWYVSVVRHFPAARSHSFTVLSYDPVITCGSSRCDAIAATVLSCPVRHIACSFVRMSHTRHALSRPPVINTSSSGCNAREYTPERWPW
eukprot:30918-Pelagococcus_subviridis.AAC.76